MAETNTSAKPKKTNMVRFFREVKAELKKVSWPSREQLVHNTVIIIAFIAIAAILLSVLDLGFSKLIGLITLLK